MVSILAFSVSDKIEQYGAYAGFASVIGLAVLSLLYFAQAREVKRLREWAGRAPERSAEIQDRVQADAQRRVVAQPVRPGVPGRPLGVPAGAQQPVTAAAQAGGATAAPAAAAAAAATAAGAAAPPAPGQPSTVQPPATNGAPPPGAGGVEVTPGQPLRVPPGTAATPAGARAAATGGGNGLDGDEERSGRPLAAILGAAAAVVAVLVVAGILLFGGSDGSKPKAAPNTIGNASSAGSGATTTPTRTTAAALPPGQFTTAVLNGTTTPGLARGVANRLQNAKFKIGNVTNATDQSHSATIIEYAPKHRREAQEVADEIDVGNDAIQALTPGSKAIAGDEAIVVVTVGTDQNQSPQQQQTTP